MQQSSTETHVSDLPPSALPPASEGTAEAEDHGHSDDEQNYHEAEVKM